LSLYNCDFYQWTQVVGKRLRTRDIADLDWENAAEEIESLGRRDRSELRSRLAVLVAHLLKWQYQPELRDSSTWRAAIDEQRLQIEAVLEDSPSLKPFALEALVWAYPRAVRSAVRDMRVRVSPFPANCPYDLGDIRREDFFPD
jgi:hypothetical protein